MLLLVLTGQKSLNRLAARSRLLETQLYILLQHPTFHCYNPLRCIDRYALNCESLGIVFWLVGF